MSLLAFFLDLEQLSLLISLDNLLVFSFVMTCGLSIRYKNTKGYKYVWLYLLGSMISSLCFRHLDSLVIQLVIAILPIGAMTKLIATDQSNLPQEGSFQMPWVPVLPCVGIYFNLMLAWQTDLHTWAQLVVYTGLGSAIYFLYGYQNR